MELARASASWLRSVGGPVLARLEVWRTLDGRVLLRQPGRGRNQMCVEILPEALPWLIEQLLACVQSDDEVSHNQCDYSDKCRNQETLIRG